MERRTFVRTLSALAAAGAAGCLDSLGSESEPGADGSRSAPTGDGRTPTETPQPTPTPTPLERTPEDDDTGMVPSQVEEWPAFGADDRHTAYRPDGVGPSTATVAWSAIEDTLNVRCPPTVSDGAVYVGADEPHAVYAFDAVTGERRWRFETADYVTAAPTVHDGRVYVGDAKGDVYALTTGGDVVWHRPAWLPILGRGLVVSDGRVYGGTTDDAFALDAETGEKLWSFTGFSDWAGCPALGEELLYVGSHDGEVAALDPATGERQWLWSTSDARGLSVWAPPAYADGTLYVSLHGGDVVALDVDTGRPDWRRRLDALNLKCSPAVTEDRVYVAGTNYYATFNTDEPETTGTPAETTTRTPAETTTRTPAETTTRTPAETTTSGTVATGTPDTTTTGTPAEPPPPWTVGRLYALSRADGSDAWVHRTDYQFRSSPAVVGDRVYVGCADGALAVSRDSGSEVWKTTLPERVHSSPAVAKGRLYIGCMDGHLYCVGRDAVETYDRDGDGRITLSELAEAAGAYVRNDVYLRDLARVAAAYVRT